MTNGGYVLVESIVIRMKGIFFMIDQVGVGSLELKLSKFVEKGETLAKLCASIAHA